jgi:cobalamin biosynthesis protein CobD/CbiB
MVNTIENRMSQASSELRFAQRARDLTRHSFARLCALTMNDLDSTRQSIEAWQELRRLRNRMPVAKVETACGAVTLTARLSKTLNKNRRNENGARDRWSTAVYTLPVHSEQYHLGLVELDENS